MLERGLEMALDCHPLGEHVGVRGRQSERGRGHARTGYDNVDIGEDLDVDVLKFRCYEAHIPYTMQFFKVSESHETLSWIY